MSVAILAFEDDRLPATALADAMGLSLRVAELHVFPDGEVLPRLTSTVGDTAVIYRSLNAPDAKIMPLLLLADAARRNGARRVVLAAPYMPYLRQDAVFHPGEPLSLDVIGRVLGGAFDRMVTVQPHLHRTTNLDPVFSPAEVTTLSVAEAFAHFLGDIGNGLIIGPDAESLAWAAAVAAGVGAEYAVLSKTRRGDRDVELALPSGSDPSGRRVVIVDDICSSGTTLGRAVQLLRQAGAASVEAVIAHALLSPADLAALQERGLHSLASTDSCPHPTNRISLTPLLAKALREEVR